MASTFYIFKGREEGDGRKWEEIGSIGGRGVDEMPVEFTRETHKDDAANFAKHLLKVSTFVEIRINVQGSKQGHYFTR